MLSQWLNSAKEVEPYSKLAFIYDFVMRHVDYQHWSQYLTHLFLDADISVRKVLDIACGTGSMMLKLRGLDYEVAGFDSSEYMVRLACEKAQRRRLRIPFWQGNMRNFKVKRHFDACICTYDSINYCLQMEECIEVMNCASEALCQGGVFIFDICTEKTSREFFNSYHENESTNDYSYIRETQYLRNEMIQINDFIITFSSNESTTFRERHRQRIYRINEISNLIPRRLFQLIGIYEDCEDFSKRPGTENSTRVHFVLKRI